MNDGLLDIVTLKMPFRDKSGGLVRIVKVILVPEWVVVDECQEGISQNPHDHAGAS